MYRHTSSNSIDVLNHIELETYKFKFGYESIDCVHCNERMWDFYELESSPYGTWPYNFMDFDTAFQTTIPAMIEMGFDPSSPKLQLRGEIGDRQTSLHICPICGWWIAVDSAVLPAVKYQFWLINLVAPSALMELSLTDVETPLIEIRNHLRRRYEDRHYIHPKIFEDTVASVFRDLGYDAYATAYSNDGGIDEHRSAGKAASTSDPGRTDPIIPWSIDSRRLHQRHICLHFAFPTRLHFDST
jgi:restriction system protein